MTCSLSYHFYFVAVKGWRPVLSLLFCCSLSYHFSLLTNFCKWNGASCNFETTTIEFAILWQQQQQPLNRLRFLRRITVAFFTAGLRFCIGCILIIIGFPANNIISLKSLTTVPIRQLQFYSSKQVHSLQKLPTRCALFKFNLHKSQSGSHVQSIDQRKYIKVHQHQVSQQAKFSKWCVCE